MCLSHIAWTVQDLDVNDLKVVSTRHEGKAAESHADTHVLVSEEAAESFFTLTTQFGGGGKL